MKGKDSVTILNLVRHLAVTLDANTVALENVKLLLAAAHEESVTLKKKSGALKLD